MPTGLSRTPNESARSGLRSFQRRPNSSQEQHISHKLCEQRRGEYSQSEIAVAVAKLLVTNRTLPGWQVEFCKVPQTQQDSPTRTYDLSTVRLESVRSGPKDKIEACGLGECLEVPVPREKRNISVDTALGDQSVTETRLPAPR